MAKQPEELPPYPLKITIGDKYRRALGLMTEDEAREEFERLVQHQMASQGVSREEAERVERHNLGYYAGYYDTDVRERVEKLFKAAHPIFGSTAISVTPREAMQKGGQLANRRLN